MTSSEAQSAAIGSPRSRMSSSWARIISVRMPRRRWVGQDADDRDAAAADRAAGHGQLEREGAGAADDPVAVERRMHPLERQVRGEPLRRLVVGGPAAEVVADRADRALELVQVLAGRTSQVIRRPRGSRAAGRCGRAASPPRRRRRARSSASPAWTSAVEVEARRGRRTRDRRRRARGRPCPRCAPRRRRRGSGRRSRDRARRVTSSTTDSPGLYERALSAASRSTSRSQSPSPSRRPSARGSRTSSGSGEPGSKLKTSTRTVRSIPCRKRQSACSASRRRRERLDHAHLALREARPPTRP